MRSPRTLTIPVALLFLGAIAAGWWWSQRTPAAQEGPPPSPPAITAAQVQAITSALNSPDPKVVGTALAVASEQPLDPALIPGLQALAPIEIDAATLQPLGSGTWQADASASPPGKRTKWRVFLTQVGGTWKLAATDPAS